MDKVFRRKDDIVSRKIAGETILVPVTGKLADMRRIFSLNPAAEYIWDNLDGRKSLSQIVDGLLSVFNSEREGAEKDAGEFVAELMKEDLITMETK